MSKLLAGSKAPVALRVVITTADADLDLSTVSSLVLRVRKPPASTPRDEEWDAVIESKTATKIVARHDFAEGDIPRAGGYVVAPVLHISGGEVPCEPRALPVADPFIP